MAEETATIEEETVEELEQERNGSGPGFILGVMLGALAGAAAATLFTPATGEEFRHRISEEAAPLLKHEEGGTADGTTPITRVRAMLTRVRSRVQEASEQARDAAEESEAGSRARYAELIHQERGDG